MVATGMSRRFRARNFACPGRGSGGSAFSGPSLAAPYLSICRCECRAVYEIHGHDYVLTPGRYVGIKDIQDDDEPFEEMIEWLVVKLEAQFAESSRLEVAIRKNLQRLAGLGDS